MAEASAEAVGTAVIVVMGDGMEGIAVGMVAGGRASVSVSGIPLITVTPLIPILMLTHRRVAITTLSLCNRLSLPNPRLQPAPQLRAQFKR
jgi:hypothetical protein